jgi:hypothetical protein
VSPGAAIADHRIATAASSGDHRQDLGPSRALVEPQELAGHRVPDLATQVCSVRS